MVELNSLHTLFQTKARNEALKKFVKDDKCMRLHISGLQGSAAALLLAGLPEYGTTTLFIANDPEEAGYLYNDFMQIRNDNRVLCLEIRTDRSRRRHSAYRHDKPTATSRRIPHRGYLPRSVVRKGGIERRITPQHIAAGQRRKMRSGIGSRLSYGLWFRAGRLRL